MRTKEGFLRQKVHVLAKGLGGWRVGGMKWGGGGVLGRRRVSMCWHHDACVGVKRARARRCEAMRSIHTWRVRHHAGRPPPNPPAHPTFRCGAGVLAG